MKKSMIVVFNRITGRELDDVSLFAGLVGEHYDKFCVLYSIISQDDFIDYIDDITCKMYDEEIDFNVELNTKFVKKLQKKLDENILNTAGNSYKIKCEEKDAQNLILSIRSL